MRLLCELVGKHKGEDAWIFGKGPGLDTFEMVRAGQLRICINESLLCVPEPTYFFAHDERPIGRVAPFWPSGCTAVLEPERARFAISCGIPPDSVCCYVKCEQDFSCLLWNPEKIARAGRLLGLSGTVHSAVHFCRLVEVKKAMLVGMDGRGGYAFRLGLKLPVGGGQHPRIRRDTERVLDALQLPYSFLDAPTDMNSCTDEES